MIRRFVGDSQTSISGPQRELSRAAPLVAVAYGQSPLPEVALEFVNGPSQAMAWPVRRVMSLIGSASGCKFRLTDASVSRFHASLLRTSRGLWIVDLLGQGGITVNDVPLRFSHLADGDRLRIGRYQIRVKYQPEHRSLANGSPGSPAHVDLKPFDQAARHERASNEPMFPDWSAPTFASGIELSNKPQISTAVQALSALTKVDVPALEVTFPFEAGSSRIDGLDAGALGQSIRRHAAADVRPVSAGHGNDGSDVRHDAP